MQREKLEGLGDEGEDTECIHRICKRLFTIESSVFIHN